MEQRSGITKWLFLGLALFLFFTVGLPMITGKDAPEARPQFADVRLAPEEQRAEEKFCEIAGDGFKARLSTLGASLRSYELTNTARYYNKAPLPGFPQSIAATFSPKFGKPTGPIDLVTTSTATRQPLRTDLVVPGDIAGSEVLYDDLSYKLTASDGKSCTFVYEQQKIDRLSGELAIQEAKLASAKNDLEKLEASLQSLKDDARTEAEKKAEESRQWTSKLEKRIDELRKGIEEAKKDGTEKSLVTRVTKTVTATDKPYELSLDVKVENLGSQAQAHRLSVEQTSWRTLHETEGSLGRQSDWATEVIQSGNDKTKRYSPSDFEPDDFKDKDFTDEHWRKVEGDAKWAAVSSSYMANILLPEGEGPTPSAETRIEEWWNWDRYKAQDKKKDPDYGHIYRARLAYPEKELKPGESASYKVLSFIGPKERELLKGLGRDTSEVINLGMFAFIGKALIWYLYKLKGLVGSWGWAICLMTITVRFLLFPLSITQIKSAAAMRKLKPQIDELNEKYKDKTAEKGLALQQLYKENGINPVAGCLPMLLQMPVWFALYSSLQTAVELYNVPFGPFIPDLSSPGKYFIIPAVLGTSSFIQQKIMPMQGDPAQQKMMLYLMPTMFTVMMLFLPAGLGVYMMTNTWLGIFQQVMVERYYKKNAVLAGTGIVVKEKDGDSSGKGDSKSSGGRDKRRQLLERGRARG